MMADSDDDPLRRIAQRLCEASRQRPALRGAGHV